MSYEQTLSGLASRAAVLLAVMLAIVAVPLLLLMAVPTGYFAKHAAFHAVWQAVVIAGAGVLALRAAVRWTRVPRELVGTVILIAAALFSVAACVALRHTRSYLQFGMLSAVLSLLVLFNVFAFTKAWRTGWRPPEADTSK